MASRSEIAEIVLRYSLDRKGVNETTRGGEQIRKDLDKTVKQAQSISSAAQKASADLAQMGRQQGSRQLTAGLQEAERAGTKTAIALDQVVDKLREIGASEAEIQRVARGLEQVGLSSASAGVVSKSAGAAGIGASALAGVGSAPGGQAVGSITSVASAFTLLGPAGAVAVGAVELFTAAMRGAEEAAKRAIADINRELDREAELRRQIPNMTTPEATDYVEGQQREFDAIRADLDAAFAARDAFWEESDWVARVRIGAGTDAVWNSLTDRINGLNKELEDALDNSAGAIDMVNNGVTAQNDANAALAAAQLEAANQTQLAARAKIEAERFATTATTDAVNERVATYQNEIDGYIEANQQLRSQNSAAANALAAANDERIKELQIFIDATNAIRGHVAAREQLEAGQTQAREAFFGLLDGLRGLPKAGAEFDKFAKGVADARKKINEEEARHAGAVEKIRADLAEKEAAIIADANQRAGDLADKYGVDRLRAEEDLERELRRLRQRAAMDRRTAEGERDAVAARKADEAAKQQEEDLVENQTVLARRREEDYKRQLQELARTTNQRLQTERAAAQKSLALEVDKFNKEIEVRRQALVAAQTQMAQYMQGVLTIGGQGYPVALQQFGAFVGGIQSIILAQMQQVQQVQTPIPQTTVGIGGGGGRYVAQRALGGWTEGWTMVNDGTGSMRGAESALTADKRLIYFDKPARVFNAQQTAAMAGGAGRGPVEVNINLDGKTIKATSRREALRAIDEVFQQMELA